VAAPVRETRSTDRPAPGILCWSCRRMTPYSEDRCQNCGAAFAGGTGGEYSISRISTAPRRRTPLETSATPSRTLADLLRDLGRVHDISTSVQRLQLDPAQTTMFQCPSCGRFVEEDARSCACGVRFAASEATFPCPECDSRVPTLDRACPVCGVRFEESPHLSYSCPRCGSPVSSDALRCACGVWFED